MRTRHLTSAIVWPLVRRKRRKSRSFGKDSRFWRRYSAFTAPSC